MDDTGDTFWADWYRWQAQHDRERLRYEREREQLQAEQQTDCSASRRGRITPEVTLSAKCHQCGYGKRVVQPLASYDVTVMLRSLAQGFCVREGLVYCRRCGGGGSVESEARALWDLLRVQEVEVSDG